MGLPQGHYSRPPVLGDAVADLLTGCVRVDVSAEDTSVERALDDWRDVNLADKAVLVPAQDGTVAG